MKFIAERIVTRPSVGRTKPVHWTRRYLAVCLAVAVRHGVGFGAAEHVSEGREHDPAVFSLPYCAEAKVDGE